jgi:hypothetical protein
MSDSPSLRPWTEKQTEEWLKRRATDEEAAQLPPVLADGGSPVRASAQEQQAISDAVTYLRITGHGAIADAMLDALRAKAIAEARGRQQAEQNNKVRCGYCGKLKNSIHDFCDETPAEQAEQARDKAQTAVMEPAQPVWADWPAPGVCRREHSERQPRCPACHEMRIAAMDSAKRLAKSEQRPPSDNSLVVKKLLGRTGDRLLHREAATAIESLEVQKVALTQALKDILEYRDRVGPLGFQLEKADDLFIKARAALAGAPK